MEFDHLAFEGEVKKPEKYLGTNLGEMVSNPPPVGERALAIGYSDSRPRG